MAKKKRHDRLWLCRDDSGFHNLYSGTEEPVHLCNGMWHPAHEKSDCREIGDWGDFIPAWCPQLLTGAMMELEPLQRKAGTV